MTAVSGDPLASLGSLSRTGFNILVALADGPKHSFAMMQDIEAVTGSQPGPGTLYAAIARLEERRWIAPLTTNDRRRPYRLTRDGLQVLRAQLAALDAANQAATPQLVDA